MILVILPIIQFLFGVSQVEHDGLRDVFLTCLAEQFLNALEEDDVALLHEDDVGGQSFELAEDMAGDEDQLVFLLADFVFEYQPANRTA